MQNISSNWENGIYCGNYFPLMVEYAILQTKVYYSPTGSKKRVLEGVFKGLSCQRFSGLFIMFDNKDTR